MNEHLLYGLVVCGGQSSRMGQDKGSIKYHLLPQKYHAFQMLSQLCDQVFLGSRYPETDTAYNTLPDDDEFKDLGPLTSLLTAIKKFPGTGFIVTGCDYPLLELNDMTAFLKSIPPHSIAAAFYNEQAAVYEPLIAYYSAEAGAKLIGQSSKGTVSLQQFLIQVNAYKYFPPDPQHILSIDTPEQMSRILKIIPAN
jgi:molybdopterin-guanine dinucleotide biosynthesis protein A